MSGGLIAWWKKPLSYVHEWILERRSSPYNPDLYISYKKGRYLLNTPEAIYSYEERYDNFGQVIEKLGAERFRANEVLLLGLGLGSIPMIFERKHDLVLQYTAVELDPVVIELCSKYALPRIEAPIEIYQGDAYLWVMSTERQYDLIMMDVFSSDVIPAEMESTTYLDALDTALRPGGMLMYNRLYTLADDRKATDAYWNDVFLKRFPGAEIHAAYGNKILTYTKTD